MSDHREAEVWHGIRRQLAQARDRARHLDTPQALLECWVGALQARQRLLEAIWESDSVCAPVAFAEAALEVLDRYILRQLPASVLESLEAVYEPG